VVSFQDGVKLARRYNIPFFETSAYDNINVNEAFDVLARLALPQAEDEHFQLELRKQTGDAKITDFRKQSKNKTKSGQCSC
jgi:hypothetical protein